MANSPCRSVARGSLEIPKSYCRARPMCRRPSTRYVSARNTLYYSSPFKRSKARDVFPVITARRRRENFGTRDGEKLYRLVASISSLASFESEKNCRSSGDWLLVQLYEICTGQVSNWRLLLLFACSLFSQLNVPLVVCQIGIMIKHQ